MTSVFAKRPPTPEEMYRNMKPATFTEYKPKEASSSSKNDNNNKSAAAAAQSTSSVQKNDINRNQQQQNQQNNRQQHSNQQQQRARNQSQSDNRRRNNSSTTRADAHPDSSNNNNSNRDSNNNPDAMRYNNSNYNQNLGNNNSVRFVPGQSTRDLPFIETKIDESNRKFLGQTRLFVGNLPHNITEDRVRDLFKQYGEIGELFLGPKSAFCFIRLDYKRNAELARDRLDGTLFEGRTLRVRLASHPAAVRVKNLSTQVTNELLAYAFRFFGEIERAVIITDEKGKSIGEGIVEFTKKPSATFAIKKCQQENFILTTTPMPVLVEPYNHPDQDEGLPERAIAKHTEEFNKEREIGPRFADQGSFEDSFASRWKELYALEKQKRDKIEAELKEARVTLQNQIEYSRIEHDAAKLKSKLKQLEDDRLRLQQYNNEVCILNPPTFNVFQHHQQQQQQHYQQQLPTINSSAQVRPLQNQGIAFNNNDDQSNTSTPVQTEPVSNSGSNLIIPSASTSQQASYADTTNMMNNQYFQTMMQPMYGAAYQPQVSMNMYQPPANDQQQSTGRARKRGRF